MVTYCKMRDGSWGLRGAASELSGTVAVKKRDGSVKYEHVGTVVVKFKDGNAIASIGGTRRNRNVCDCDCAECSSGCRCDAHCNCRGGNIYDC